MNNVFNIFLLKGKYIYRTCINKFEGRLSKSKFKSNEIHLISNMKLFDHCQGHVNECLVHWNGLLGDVRATDSWCTGPRWTSTGHSSAGWDMLWSPHKHMAYGMIVNTKPVSSNESHKCFSFDKQFYQTDWSDKQLCWKAKALSKNLIKYIQISKQIYSDKLFQVVSFWHTNLRSY